MCASTAVQWSADVRNYCGTVERSCVQVPRHSGLMRLESSPSLPLTKNDSKLLSFSALLRWCSDLLRAGRSGDRIPLKARFSAPVQTGPEAHPAFRRMFPGATAAEA